MQHRGSVTFNLGTPVQTYVRDDVTVDVHELQFGNEPSAGRAIAQAFMDVLTFGFWEILAVPIEGLQGKTETVTVEYRDDKVVSVKTVEGRYKKQDLAKQ